MTVKEARQKLTARQREGRAVNAVADLLRRTLSVPNIYIEPPRPVVAADLLAVDRGGAGDLHAVEIKLDNDVHLEPSILRSPQDVRNSFVSVQIKKNWREKLQGIQRELMALPAHFRYLALPADTFNSLSEELQFSIFSDDGIGRLGVITLKQNGTEIPKAELAIPAERFRVDPVKIRRIETKLVVVRPDIEVRI